MVWSFLTSPSLLYDKNNRPENKISPAILFQTRIKKGFQKYILLGDFMNCIIVREKRKRLSFKVKEEQEEKFIVFKVSRFSGYTAKKIIKEINNNRLQSVAFDNNIPHEFKEMFLGKIHIVKSEDVLFLNIDKIADKIASLHGIEDGKLNLAIVPGYKIDVMFDKLRNIRRKIKTLTVFTNNPEGVASCSDLFYKQTGIPVVIKKENEISGFDILLYLNREKGINIVHSGRIVDIFSKIDGPAIRDVTIKFKKEKNRFNVSDCVFSKIIDAPFEIKGFITKNT